MDDLTNSIDSFLMSDDSLLLSNPHQAASHIHPRLYAYKKKTLCWSSNQEERRRYLLEEQKKKRQSVVESLRHVNDKHENISQQKPLKKTSYKKSPYELMFSEWLEEIPNDFESNWIMTLCPVGKRCIVVASEGTTTIYNKGGKIINKHNSKLPGGNSLSKQDVTVLDCIYSESTRTYYLLDCLCWKNHPIIDSEAEFRFYWLKCKLAENLEVQKISYDNSYKFVDVPRIYECKSEQIEEIIQMKQDFEIDGLLFYHKNAHYTDGYTPLVLWLKAYMLPEILNIKVPEFIKNQAPSDYNNARQTIRTSIEEINNFKTYLTQKQASRASNNNNNTDNDDTSEILDLTSNSIIEQ